MNSWPTSENSVNRKFNFGEFPSTTREVFEMYLERVLRATLRSGQIVVMEQPLGA
jgi:hypothetical protein